VIPHKNKPSFKILSNLVINFVKFN